MGSAPAGQRNCSICKAGCWRKNSISFRSKRSVLSISAKASWPACFGSTRCFSTGSELARNSLTSRLSSRFRPANTRWASSTGCCRNSSPARAHWNPTPEQSSNFWLNHYGPVSWSHWHPFWAPDICQPGQRSCNSRGWCSPSRLTGFSGSDWWIFSLPASQKAKIFLPFVIQADIIYTQ